MSRIQPIAAIAIAVVVSTTDAATPTVVATTHIATQVVAATT